MSEALLTVSGVSKIFGKLRALDNVSLEVRKGEILGLVGPNGSGKSTLINVISGFFGAEEGEIFLEDRHCQLASHKIAAYGISRTYQIPRPFPTLTALENVKVGGYFGKKEKREEVDRKAREILDFVGLGHRADVEAEHLTLHQRKQLELARALACRPDLIMLDEVLAGLNPTEIDSAVELVKKIRNLGITVLFVEHNMKAVVNLCDRLVVLQAGKLIADGTPEEVLTQSEVIEAYLGKKHAQN